MPKIIGSINCIHLLFKPNISLIKLIVREAFIGKARNSEIISVKKSEEETTVVVATILLHASIFHIAQIFNCKVVEAYCLCLFIKVPFKTKPCNAV